MDEVRLPSDRELLRPTILVAQYVGASAANEVTPEVLRSPVRWSPIQPAVRNMDGRGAEIAHVLASARAYAGRLSDRRPPSAEMPDRKSRCLRRIQSRLTVVLKLAHHLQSQGTTTQFAPKIPNSGRVAQNVRVKVVGTAVPCDRERQHLKTSTQVHRCEFNLRSAGHSSPG